MQCYFCENFFMTIVAKAFPVCIFSMLLWHGAEAQIAGDTLHYQDEKHFKNIQQLTFGGDNAEAYWSFDGKQIIFQRTNTINIQHRLSLYLNRISEQVPKMENDLRIANKHLD